MAVTPDAIIASAEKLLGAPYRLWYQGDSTPMWLDDDVGDPPSAEYLLGVGVECADLINFALEDNGLGNIQGTQYAINYLENMSTFDFYKPGQRGAVAYRPFEGPWEGGQGHIALYWDDRYLIQSVNGVGGVYGVTYKFTDQYTYQQSADCQFTIYGFLPGVGY